MSNLHFPLDQKEPAIATSTVKDAFTDIWNLYFILMGLAGIAIILFLQFNFGFSLLLFAFALMITIFLVFQLWGMLTIRIEVSRMGINYQAAQRKVMIKWDQIEGVKIENWKKQITFWINGKPVRIHEFGLNPKEKRIVREILLNYLEIYRIPTEVT